ncbi:hypothetical protein [Sulfuracidifex tepidarius]|uniref:Zinc-ribbon domain-containing protein n=1 Tax=Sulfuracidifex tepidarius TaxID=1294262 RepID=A0A510E3H1_9CREN|nr:hypothetical protein [Sulfuracidifex tepidarius]BBG24298.1 hypothetical protein IC006_1608 [Sulfuracidifex tepidarius]BBG27055.1 hypothetical protein IC007_1585 [Sulfuracidifex tepidarius]
MVKYCPICGHPNCDSNEVCMSCGFNFKASPFIKGTHEKTQKERPDKFTPKDFIAILIVIISIILLFLFYDI